jgi:hypothetical protein
VILMHGSANTIAKFLGPILMGSAAYGVFWWALAALWWVVALAAIALTGVARNQAPSMEPATLATSAARVR